VFDISVSAAVPTENVAANFKISVYSCTSNGHVKLKTAGGSHPGDGLSDIILTYTYTPAQAMDM
jgi:hypothetical protein